MQPDAPHTDGKHTTDAGNPRAHDEPVVTVLFSVAKVRALLVEGDQASIIIEEQFLDTMGATSWRSTARIYDVSPVYTILRSAAISRRMDRDHMQFAVRAALDRGRDLLAELDTELAGLDAAGTPLRDSVQRFRALLNGIHLVMLGNEPIRNQSPESQIRTLVTGNPWSPTSAWVMAKGRGEVP